MRRLLRRARRLPAAAARRSLSAANTVAFVVGLVGVAIGFGLAWLPLGFIVGGAGCSTCAWLLERGDRA